MIGCGNRCFSALGKTRMRTKWFGRRQTKDLNDRVGIDRLLLNRSYSQAVQG
jgi:hypothetical protein